MQVTYIAPEGDAQSVLMGGFTFEDGIPVEVPADARIAGKLKTNPYFIVDEDAGLVEEASVPEKRVHWRHRKAASND